MRFKYLVGGVAALVASCGGGFERAGTPGTPGTPSPVIKGEFQAGLISGPGYSNQYQMFVPLNYDATKKWPVIVVLHGSGDEGNDNQKQLLTGLGPVVNAQKSTWPAITVFPQRRTTDQQRGGYLFIAIASLDSMIAKYNGDPTRAYLFGLSAGGQYGFEVIYWNPTRFAAYVPVAAHICTL